MALKPIVLVGPMGAGKSTIGRLLAQSLNCSFVDHDDIIIREAKTSIPDIFENHGEPYFRDLEMRCLRSSLFHPQFAVSAEAVLDKFDNLPVNEDEIAHTPIVMAGGGGIAGREDNRELLKKFSNCIYLELDVDTQYERIKGDVNRPMLTIYHNKERLSELKSIRDPLYREVAKAIIDSSQTPEKVVADCLAFLQAEAKA